MPRLSSTVGPIERIDLKTFEIPTDQPESDGTLDWNKTMLVLVEASGGGKQGLGYTYADAATALLIRDTLASMVTGSDVMSPPAAYMQM